MNSGFANSLGFDEKWTKNTIFQLLTIKHDRESLLDDKTMFINNENAHFDPKMTTF